MEISFKALKDFDGQLKDTKGVKNFIKDEIYTTGDEDGFKVFEKGGLVEMTKSKVGGKSVEVKHDEKDKGDVKLAKKEKTEKVDNSGEL